MHLLQADQLIVEKAVGFFSQFWFFYLDGTYLGQIAVERMLALYRSGWVPVEQQQLFKDYRNPYVQVNKLLSAEERMMLLAMITIWFAQAAKV